MQVKHVILFLCLVPCALPLPIHTFVPGALAVTALGAIVGGYTGFYVVEKVHYGSRENCKAACDLLEQKVNVPNPLDQAAKDKTHEPLMPVYEKLVHNRYLHSKSLRVEDLAKDVAQQAGDRIAMLLEDEADLQRYKHYDRYADRVPNLRILEKIYDKFYRNPRSSFFDGTSLGSIKDALLGKFDKEVREKTESKNEYSSALDFPLHHHLMELESILSIHKKFIEDNTCNNSKSSELHERGLERSAELKADLHYCIEEQKMKIWRLESENHSLACQVSALQSQMTSVRLARARRS